MKTPNSVPTLNHLFFHHVETFRRDRLLVWQKHGETVVYSSERFASAVFALRDFLFTSGLVEGDRVAIFSENRPEWHVADFAILLARQVVVPIYPTLVGGQVQYLLENSGCRAVIVSGQRQCEMLESILAAVPQVEWIISMDECGVCNAPNCKLTSFTRVLKNAAPPDEAAKEVIRSAALSIDPQSVATIVYTSGTTGRPKGVMLSHANIAFDLEGCIARLGFRTVEQALSVLPLPHVFERLLCYGYFRLGVPIAYGDPHELRDLLKLHHPQVMGCVPRVLEKIREAIETQVENMSGWKQSLARRVFRSVREHASRAAAGQRAGFSSFPGKLPQAVLSRRGGRP